LAGTKPTGTAGIIAAGGAPTAGSALAVLLLVLPVLPALPVVAAGGDVGAGAVGVGVGDAAGAAGAGVTAGVRAGTVAGALTVMRSTTGGGRFFVRGFAAAGVEVAVVDLDARVMCLMVVIFLWLNVSGEPRARRPPRWPRRNALAPTKSVVRGRFSGNDFSTRVDFPDSRHAIVASRARVRRTTCR
jgi:hypothetical protein